MTKACFDNCRDSFSVPLSRLSERFAYDEDSHSCISRRLAGGRLKHVVRVGRGGYYIVSLNGKFMSCHRLVLVLNSVFPLEHQKCVDHIDRNRRNNRLENLRWATLSENSRNATPRSRGKSFGDTALRNAYFSWENGLYESKWRHPATGQWVRVGFYESAEEASFQASVSRAEALGSCHH
jgi:hypothetical protein